MSVSVSPLTASAIPRADIIIRSKSTATRAIPRSPCLWRAGDGQSFIVSPDPDVHLSIEGRLRILAKDGVEGLRSPRDLYLHKCNKVHVVCDVPRRIEVCELQLRDDRFRPRLWRVVNVVVLQSNRRRVRVVGDGDVFAFLVTGT